MLFPCCCRNDAVIDVHDRLATAQKENQALRTLLAERMSVSAVERSVRLNVAHQNSVATFVDTLIQDEHVNIKGLPDSVERKIYTNVFELLLNLMRDTLAHVNVNVLGHQIMFKMELPVQGERETKIDH